MLPQEFISIITTRRFDLGDEKALQAEIASVLTELSVNFHREVRLAPGDIVDFMLPGGTAVEVKITAPKRAIYRQCKRYCDHDAVRALVLVTATAIGFPEEINGKPCWVASLGRAWL